VTPSDADAASITKAEASLAVVAELAKGQLSVIFPTPLRSNL
jgi:hypothetical protein